MRLSRLLPLVLVAACATAPALTLRAVWDMLGEVELTSPIARIAVYRERGPSGHAILAVHEQIFVEKIDGRIVRTYRDEACDLWVDVNRDGRFDPKEHRRKTDSEHVCALSHLPGTMTLGPGVELAYDSAPNEAAPVALRVRAATGVHIESRRTQLPVAADVPHQ